MTTPNSLGELIERLRRTEKRKSYFATNRTAPIIESEYDGLLNPDGPEAADTLERLRDALTAIAEGNLGPFDWQANYDRIREVAREALTAKGNRGDD